MERPKTGNSASAPIDLTDPTPSPPSISSAVTSIKQLSSYATNTQTHVATLAPIQTRPGPAGKLVAPSTALSSHNEATAFSSSSSSISSVVSSSVDSSSHTSPDDQQPKPNARNPPPALVDYGGIPSPSDGSVLLEKAPRIKVEVPQSQPSDPNRPASSQDAQRPFSAATGSIPAQPVLETGQVTSSSPLPTSLSVVQADESFDHAQMGVVSSEPLNTEFPPLRINCSVGEEEEGEERNSGRGQEGKKEQ